MSNIKAEANSEPNSGANSGSVPAKRKRGNPNLQKGGPSLNPSGKAKPADQQELERLRARVADLEARERARELAAVDPAGGMVTAARMRKVLGQDAMMDCGPTEQRLREWLNKDVAKYEMRARELEAEESDIAAVRAHNVRLEEENAALRKQLIPAAAPESTDDGAARAMSLIDRIFEDLEQQSAEEQTRYVKDGLCAMCGQKPIPGRGQAGRCSSEEAEGRERRTRYSDQRAGGA